MFTTSTLGFCSTFQPNPTLNRPDPPANHRNQVYLVERQERVRPGGPVVVARTSAFTALR